MEIVKDVYTILPKLPDYERFGLLTQLTRASVSLASNIAEGSAKSSDKDFKRYLKFSLDSSYELESHLILTFEFHGIKTDFIVNKIHKEQMMLSSFINKLSPFSF